MGASTSAMNIFAHVFEVLNTRYPEVWRHLLRMGKGEERRALHSNGGDSPWDDHYSGGN